MTVLYVPCSLDSGVALLSAPNGLNLNDVRVLLYRECAAACINIRICIHVEASMVASEEGMEDEP